MLAGLRFAVADLWWCRRWSLLDWRKECSAEGPLRCK